eukprot:953181-Amphidinium_carterae.1
MAPPSPLGGAAAAWAHSLVSALVLETAAVLPVSTMFDSSSSQAQEVEEGAKSKQCVNGTNLLTPYQNARRLGTLARFLQPRVPVPEDRKECCYHAGESV